MSERPGGDIGPAVLGFGAALVGPALILFGVISFLLNILPFSRWTNCSILLLIVCVFVFLTHVFTKDFRPFRRLSCSKDGDDQ